MPPTLPFSPAFITTLLDSLKLPLPPTPADDSATNARASTASNTRNLNPLLDAPEAVKNQLLTLHVIFPNEFLPALDLLDRRLVTRFRIRGNRRGGHETAPNRASHDDHVQHSRTPGLRGEGGGVEVAQDLSAEALSAPSPVVEDTEFPDAEMLDPGSEGGLPLTRVGEEEGPRLSRAHGESGTHTTAVQQDADVDMDMGPEEPDDHPPAENKDENTIYYVRSAQQRSSRHSTSYDSTTSYEVRLRAWNCSCPAFAFSVFPSNLPEPTPAPTASRNNDERKVEGDEGRDGWRFGGLSLGDSMPPVCKHLLACVLVERVGMFGGYMEEKEVSVEEAAGWAAGWGDQ